MKTLNSILVLTATLVVSQSCRKGSLWGIYGKGTDMTQTRSVSDFGNITNNCDANVYFVQDSVYSLQVSGQENILSVLETKVENNQLKIDYRREVRSHNEVKITVHGTKMTSFNVNGSGNINVQSTLNADNIGLYISGSGNISIPKLNSTYIDSKMSGSGNISVDAGTGKSAFYSISGSGNVNAIGMQCQDATIRISGSGNVTVNASNNLNVNISGSGDIRYKNKPTINTQISGSGKLIHVE